MAGWQHNKLGSTTRLWSRQSLNGCSNSIQHVFRSGTFDHIEIHSFVVLVAATTHCSLSVAAPLVHAEQTSIYPSSPGNRAFFLNSTSIICLASFSSSCKNSHCERACTIYSSLTVPRKLYSDPPPNPHLQPDESTHTGMSTDPEV